MKKAVIQRELSTLIDESPLTIGEILYSIMVGTKVTKIAEIKYLDNDTIIKAIDNERKAVTDQPMSDTEFNNWINSK